MKKYFLIGIDDWGKLIDSNLFLNEADRAISEKKGMPTASMATRFLSIPKPVITPLKPIHQL